MAIDLQQTADVACEDGPRACRQDPFCLALAKLGRHFGLGQVVTAGRPAAVFALSKRDKLQSRDHAQQLPWLRSNLLSVAQSTRIVIGGLDWQRMLRFDGTEFHQEFVDVLHPGCKLLSRFLRRGTMQEMPVLLEDGTTATRVVDDYIDWLATARQSVLEDLAVGGGKLLCG